MGDTRLADLASGLRAFGTAYAMGGFLLAGQVFHVTHTVHLQAVGLASGDIHLDVPVVAASAFGQHNVFCQALCCALVPHKVHPYDVAARDVGETHVLALVFADMLVNHGAVALLVDMVAV